jgi:hypothetical protein
VRIEPDVFARSKCAVPSDCRAPEATLRKWKKCYGKAYEHNSWIPRDNWLTDDEKQAIIKFHFDHPLEGYRRLTYMMIDADSKNWKCQKTFLSSHAFLK